MAVQLRMVVPCWIGYFILLQPGGHHDQFDSLGHVQLSRYYRDNDFSQVSGTMIITLPAVFDAEVLPDGRIAACGMVTDSFTNGANNIWLVVLDSVGCWMPGCADGLQNTIITHVTQVRNSATHLSQSEMASVFLLRIQIQMA